MAPYQKPGTNPMISSKPSQMNTPSLRVMIVDDIAEVRQDLRTALTLEGVHAGVPLEIVGEAANGSEAIQLVTSLHPDVILMDLGMPILDGCAATLQIKKQFPSCRVIALTVHDYEAARQKAFQSGVDGFIVKGAAIETLVQMISG
jgi:DNA-binding NarL/FixJ family response regulator